MKYAFVLLLVLSACAAPPAKPVPTADPAVAACADGACRLSVSKPVTVVLDKRFAVSRLSLSVRDNRLVVDLTGTDGEGRSCDAVATGACEINAGGEPLHFDVRSVSDGTAVVDISS
jgi:hypothetical protein